MTTRATSGNTTKCSQHKKQNIEAVCLYAECQQPVLSCFNCRLKHQDHPESYIHIDTFLNSVDEQFNVAQLQRQFEHKCANLRLLKDELRQKFTVLVSQVMQKAELMLSKFNEQVDCHIDSISNSYNPCLQFIKTLKSINASSTKLEETTFSKLRSIFAIHQDQREQKESEETGETKIILHFLPQQQIEIPFEAAKESSSLISTRVTKYLAEFDCLLNSLVNLTSALKEKSNRSSNVKEQSPKQQSSNVPSKAQRSSLKQEQNNSIEGCYNQRKTPSFLMNQISENSNDSNSNTAQNYRQTNQIVSQQKESPRKELSSKGSHLFQTIDQNSLQRDFQNQSYQLRQPAVPQYKVVQINSFSEPSVCMQDSIRDTPSPGEFKCLSGSGKVAVSEINRNSGGCGKQLIPMDSSSFQIIEESSSLKNRGDNQKEGNLERNGRTSGQNEQYQQINSRSSQQMQEKIRLTQEIDGRSSGSNFTFQQINSEKRKKDQVQQLKSSERNIQQGNSNDKTQQNSLNSVERISNSSQKHKNSSYKSSKQSSEHNQVPSRYSSVAGSQESV